MRLAGAEQQNDPELFFGKFQSTAAISGFVFDLVLYISWFTSLGGFFGYVFTLFAKLFYGISLECHFMTFTNVATFN